MKKWTKSLAALMMSGLLCVSLAACSSSGGDKAYPVGLDGTEIIVGETTLSALYDAGYAIESLNQVTHIGRIPVEASFELEANSFYSGIIVLKDDVSVAMLSIVTDKKAVTASEAVIASVTIGSELHNPLDSVTFDGVSLPELTAETFKEHVSGSKVRDDGTSAYFSGKKYSARANYENGAPVKLEVSRSYDVDRYSK